MFLKGRKNKQKKKKTYEKIIRHPVQKRKQKVYFEEALNFKLKKLSVIL